MFWSNVLVKCFGQMFWSNTEYCTMCFFAPCAFLRRTPCAPDFFGFAACCGVRGAFHAVKLQNQPGPSARPSGAVQASPDAGNAVSRRRWTSRVQKRHSQRPQRPKQRRKRERRTNGTEATTRDQRQNKNTAAKAKSRTTQEIERTKKQKAHKRKANEKKRSGLFSFSTCLCFHGHLDGKQ